MLVIANGTVIEPATGIFAPRSVVLDGGCIAEVGERTPEGGDETIDATGLLVAPGFVDVHVHLREPGFEYKEDIASGSRAAAAGGFTTICCMPNTRPANDAPETTRAILARAEEVGLVRVRPVAAISRALGGKSLAPVAALATAGAVALSDDGFGVQDDALMREALHAAKAAGLVVISHCEAKPADAQGVMNAGALADRLGVSGIPRAWENEMIARDITLARETGARLHLAHVSTAEGIAAMRAAKAEGLPVTCEVTPHHLLLNEEAVERLGAQAKMNPPLRTPADCEALVAGLLDGTVDAIATDHAPHAADEKGALANAAFGIVGLETAFALCHDRLVMNGTLPLERLVELFTIGPARALHLEAGTLAAGAAADIVLIDPQARWRVDPEQFQSKGRNTPFAGGELCGRVQRTIVGGRSVFAEGAICA